MKVQTVARMGIVRRAQGARRKAMSVRIVDDEQRSDRPQDPCALRVAAARAHLRRCRPSTMYTDIACGPTPCICARGARNAVFSTLLGPKPEIDRCLAKHTGR